jgi:hypothetical protein
MPTARQECIAPLANPVGHSTGSRATTAIHVPTSARTTKTACPAEGARTTRSPLSGCAGPPALPGESSVYRQPVREGLGDGLAQLATAHRTWGASRLAPDHGPPPPQASRLPGRVTAPSASTCWLRLLRCGTAASTIKNARVEVARRNNPSGVLSGAGSRPDGQKEKVMSKGGHDP